MQFSREVIIKLAGSTPPMILASSHILPTMMKAGTNSI